MRQRRHSQKVCMCAAVAAGMALAVPAGAQGPCVGTVSTNSVFCLAGATVTPVVINAQPRPLVGPYAVALPPAGLFMFASNVTNTLSATDPFNVVSPLIGGAIPISTGQTSIKYGPPGTAIAGFVYTVDQHQPSVPAGGVTDYAITVIDSAMALPILNLGAGAVVNAIPTEIAPVDVAFSSDGLKMYVTHSGSNHVLVLDPMTGAQIASVDIGDLTAGIATIPMSAAGLGIAPSAYATVPNPNGPNGSVAVIDIATDTLVGTIPVGQTPVGVAVNAPGTTAYVVNYGSSSVSAIDTATATVIAEIPVGASPSQIYYDAAADVVVTVNPADRTLSVISPAALAVVATIPFPYDCLADFLGVGVNPCPIPPPPVVQGAEQAAASPGPIGHNGYGGKEPTLYYSKSDGSVGAFGLYTGAAGATIAASAFKDAGPPIPPLTEREIAYDPFSKLLWYSTYDGKAGQIRAIDPLTLAPSSKIIQNLADTVPGFPATDGRHWDRHLFLDYAGKRLLTPNPDGSVSLYDLNTLALVGTIPGSFFADGYLSYLRHLASDTRSGNIWYAALDGTFREFKLDAKGNATLTGRMIPFQASKGFQYGTNPASHGADFGVRRHFVVDPKSNQIIYDVENGGAVALGGLSLNNLKETYYVMGPALTFLPDSAADATRTITLASVDQCQLTVSAQPSAAGSVATSPTDHAGGYFDCGTVVTVRGVANAGYQFSGFSGDLSGSANGQTITLDGAKNVTANFTPAPSTATSSLPAER